MLTISSNVEIGKNANAQYLQIKHHAIITLAKRSVVGKKNLSRVTTSYVSRGRHFSPSYST